MKQYVIVKAPNLAKRDGNDLIKGVFRAKAILSGSLAVSNSIMHSRTSFIHLLKMFILKPILRNPMKENWLLILTLVIQRACRRQPIPWGWHISPIRE